jgi:hypothetical protein
MWGFQLATEIMAGGLALRATAGSYTRLGHKESKVSSERKGKLF